MTYQENQRGGYRYRWENFPQTDLNEARLFIQKNYPGGLMNFGEDVLPVFPAVSYASKKKRQPVNQYTMGRRERMSGKPGPYYAFHDVYDAKLEPYSYSFSSENRPLKEEELPEAINFQLAYVNQYAKTKGIVPGLGVFVEAGEPRFILENLEQTSARYFPNAISRTMKRLMKGRNVLHEDITILNEDKTMKFLNYHPPIDYLSQRLRSLKASLRRVGSSSDRVSQVVLPSVREDLATCRRILRAFSKNTDRINEETWDLIHAVQVEAVAYDWLINLLGEFSNMAFFVLPHPTTGEISAGYVGFKEQQEAAEAMQATYKYGHFGSYLIMGEAAIHGYIGSLSRMNELRPGQEFMEEVKKTMTMMFYQAYLI